MLNWLQLQLKQTFRRDASWSLVTAPVELASEFVPSMLLKPFTCSSTNWTISEADLGWCKPGKNVHNTQNLEGPKQTCIIRTKFYPELTKTHLNQMRFMQRINFPFICFPLQFFNNGLWYSAKVRQHLGKKHIMAMTIYLTVVIINCMCVGGTVSLKYISPLLFHSLNFHF